MESNDLSEDSIDLRKPLQSAPRPKTKGHKADLLRPSDPTSGLNLTEKPSRNPNKFFNSLIHKMFHGFALFEVRYDPLGKPYDFQFVEVNPAFEQVVGLKADQMVGNTLSLALGESEPAWMDLCIKRMGTTAISPLMNMLHQLAKSMRPIMMTTTPIMIPNTFDTTITPFSEFS